MSYRDQGSFSLSSLGFDDWALVSATLAFGASAFFLVFHLLAWFAGWLGPFLWFGSVSRLSDILGGTAGVAFGIFIVNLFGAASFLAISAIAKRVRRKF